MPSRLAPYPARPVKIEQKIKIGHSNGLDLFLPKFPMVQTAGHRPAMLFAPGKVTEAWTRPPVKQNLFHVDIKPP